VKHKVFIDGREGTTGLEIHERLAKRPDIELLEIEPQYRKDPEKKRALMSAADVVVLCLPDTAAVEAVALGGDRTRIIDASTAHRTAKGWTYGMAELTEGQRTELRSAARVGNPGCYPTGFLLAVRPLVDSGLVPSDYPVSVHALSGYSGGGKKMIEAFESHDHSGKSPSWTVRPYGLTLQHKHVPEMHVYSKLAHAPVFSPNVGNYYQGMLVSVPLQTRLLAPGTGPQTVHDVLASRYAKEPFVRVMPLGLDAAPGGLLSPTECNGTNRVELFVFGNEEQLLVVARLDNLGKGASGAAVQNLNLMLGADETAGLS
jgi:N-acetyl-gamma-glutamyl-phosphate reductase